MQHMYHMYDMYVFLYTRLCIFIYIERDIYIYVYTDRICSEAGLLPHQATPAAPRTQTNPCETDCNEKSV